MLWHGKILYLYISDLLGVLQWFSIFPNTFYFIVLFYVATFVIYRLYHFFLSRYTAVGVFVLGRMFREAWGTEASKQQAEFNNFLEVNLNQEQRGLNLIASIGFYGSSV